jgi:hypothetical protein
VGILGDEVVWPVGAVVGDEQPQVAPEDEVTPDARVWIERHVVHVDDTRRRIRVVDGVVLEEGQLRVAPPVGFVFVSEPVGVRGVRVPAVIGELVVIPGEDEGVALVHLLEEGIGAVGAVEIPVVGHRVGDELHLPLPQVI